MAYGQTGAGKTYTLSDKLTSGGGITAVGGYITLEKLGCYHETIIDCKFYMNSLMSLFQFDKTAHKSESFRLVLCRHHSKVGGGDI